MVTMSELLALMYERGASDLHLTVGVPPMLRVDGLLTTTSYEPLNMDSCQTLIFSLMTDDQRQRFEAHNELDFAFGIKGIGRLRMNVFRQRGAVGAAIRYIASKFKSFEELNLPPVIYDLMKLKKGLILVTGPTGAGKSTTLASMINYLNENYNYHVMTVEDPIEYIHIHKMSIVNQREVGADTESFDAALRHVLRQDPNVILIGEMRDLETIQAALNIAETGHLVFATLHTNDAVQTINRVIDVFPPHQQEHIRVQLSFFLQAVLAQQLILHSSGTGLTLACEVLIATPAIRNIIRESKIEQIMGIMQAGGKFGMVTMNQSLAELYLDKAIAYQEAVIHCADIEDFKKYLQRGTLIK
ncbi:MAG: type IV pilus twitching motility protein PilT [Elusimicrobia bacterium]|nr:type IV pilus twitching motility protein PilT [Elusimicrobiota bacterium]